MKRCRAAQFQTFGNEQGAILVISLIFVFILSIAGTMAYRMTSSELQIAGSFASNKEAFYAANAGVEEARMRMALPSTDSNVIYDSSSPPDATWTVFLLATSSTDPIADPDYSGATTTNSLQTDPDLEYWVKIQHKTEGGNIVYYGYQNPLSSLTLAPFSSSAATEYRPVDVITAHGIGEKGRSTLQVEVAHDPGPPIVAALYAEWDIDGEATLYPLSITGDASKTPPVDDVYIFPSTADYYLDDHNPTATLPSIQTGNTNINIIHGINNLKQWKTSTTPSDCYNGDYNICSSSGDLTITGQVGTGVLLVEGTLTLQATLWDGLILVKHDLLLDGSTGITINGAVLVNYKTWINTGAFPGSVAINYDRTEIDNALSKIPLRVLTWEDVSMMP